MNKKNHSKKLFFMFFMTLHVLHVCFALMLQSETLPM